MGRGRYRPAHSAHGKAYRVLVMWPVILERAVNRIARGGRRSMPHSRDWRWRRPLGSSATPSARKGPPPPPPPRSQSIPKVWRIEEGGVRPQWNGTLDERTVPQLQARVSGSVRARNGTVSP